METVLQLEGVYLAMGSGLNFGPLDMRLQSGEGAVITGGDLDALRALMRCCLGEGRPDGGTVTWWTEHRPTDSGWAACDFYRQIGYVDRHSQLLSNMSLMDNVLLFFDYARIERAAAREQAREILDALELGPYEQTHTDLLPEPQRRLALYALALCGRPRLFLMERPHQFLGPDFQKLWDSILRRAQNGLAYIVFDRSGENYDTNDFQHRLKLFP